MRVNLEEFVQLIIISKLYNIIKLEKMILKKIVIEDG